MAASTSNLDIENGVTKFNEAWGAIVYAKRPILTLTETDNDHDSEDEDTYVTKKTINIAAGTIVNYVLIKFDLSITGVRSTSAPAVGYAQITVDSVQKFEKSVSGQQVSGSGDATYSWGNSGAFAYKYEPSTAEKAAGFTIDLDIKSNYPTGSSATGEQPTAHNYHWEIWSQ